VASSASEDLGATTKFEDAVRSVQQWNEAIKSPGGGGGGGEGKGSVVGGQVGGMGGLQRTNLRGGVVAGVMMTPPKFRESVMDKQIAGAKTDPFRSPESSRTHPFPSQVRESQRIPISTLRFGVRLCFLGADFCSG